MEELDDKLQEDLEENDGQEEEVMVEMLAQDVMMLLEQIQEVRQHRLYDVQFVVLPHTKINC